MKIALLLGAALLLGTGSITAQGKIDAGGRQLLDLYKSGNLSLRQQEGFIAVPASRAGEALVDVIVKTTDGAVLDSLAACGYNVEYISRSFSVVTMPVDGIEKLAERAEVESLSFGEKAEPSMDKARGLSYVNTVHTGLGIAYDGDRRHPFKGDGVVVGMFDTGFDPSHINFLSEDGTTCRLKYYARYGSSASNPVITTGDAIRKASSDDTGETHATHVAGIMGGAYNGAGTYAMGSDASTVNLYGVAPASELAICAGPLYPANILAGIRKLIEYAEDQQKPLVVNLSLANNRGRHDGTDDYSRALAELGEEAIICVAAGNEGGDYIHAGTTFTADNTSMMVAIKDNVLGYASIDVWSSTAEEIKVSVILAKANTGEIVAKITSQNNKTIRCGEGEGTDHTLFKNSYHGAIALTAVEDNGRYNVNISAETVEPMNGTDEILGLMIEGVDGTRVDAYLSSSSYDSFAVSVPKGFTRGDNDGSISGMACGDNIIVVGSYGNRGNWTTIDGATYGTGGAESMISSYSSWGVLVDGRKLPHICAPGGGVCSSYSGYYVASKKDEAEFTLVANALEGETTTHYWGCTSGTSMATPYVTGTVGLWLEADPTLTVDKVLRIIQETARRDDYVTDVVAWGAGKIHASDGIKQVISEMGGVNDIAVDAADIYVHSIGLAVNAYAPGGKDMTARLYTTAGVLVAEEVATGGDITIEAPAAGLYILQVKAGDAVKTVKLAL